MVLEVADNEAPLWRYWGPKLAADSLPPLALRQLRATPPASFDIDQPLTIAPTFGIGWLGKSALLAHRGGQQFAHQWTRCELVVGNASDAGQKVSFTLRDPVAQLRLEITLTLDRASDLLTIQSGLHNDGEDVLDVSWFAAASLPLPASSRHLQTYGGEWANEFQIRREALSRSGWSQETYGGRTSHHCFPGALVLCEGATDHFGKVYAAHLGWSGNHAQSIESLRDGRYQWQLGEWLAPGEVRLLPNESLESPTVYAAFSAAGLNGVARCFHAGVRAQLPWLDQQMRPRPVHLNTWEAVYFDHDEESLKALASSAAELGVERFVLDDGWFHGRSHDGAGLGDWWPDTQKFPYGLLPLAKHVEACGMSFGLWVEPEMVNPDSDLYRAHPDWVLGIDGRERLTGRKQLVLNLARPEVSDYLFERLHQLLSTLPIKYLKWDMNRDLASAGANGRAAYRIQVLALYQLLARLRATDPALEIERCASGGGRIDFGILGYTNRVWTSDCNDALSRVAIQRGALQWLPPEILGAHIGSVPSHTTGRSQSLAFRAAVALGAHFGLELDVRKLTTQERASLSEWIALHQRLRAELHQSTVWQGDAGDGIVWQAHGSATSLILLVYRLTPTAQRYSPQVVLPMVAGECEYFVERLDPEATSAPQIPGLTDLRFRGDWLLHDGLPLPRMLAETAAVYRLTALN